MSVKKSQIEEELSKIKEDIKVLSEKKMMPEDSTTSVSSMIRYFTDKEERMNRALANITGKVMELEKAIAEKEAVMPQDYVDYEIPVSSLDANILDFVKQKGMACADDVRTLMNYKGRNAACSRLKKLEKDGFLQKFQLGHKVYYRYYAGKTTKTLIISPPQ